MNKISFIGTGNLGAAIANEVAKRGLAKEILMIDMLKNLAEGQAADIQQALPFCNRTKVYSGEYDQLSGSDIIVITAGKPRTPDIKDRLELAGINFKIISSVMAEVKKYCPEAILIMTTNPLDLVNRFIFESGFDRRRVIGLSGQLDSSRFRVALGHPQHDVKAYVFGEHGDNQVPIFSKVIVDGKKKKFNEEEKTEIWKRCKAVALEVIEKKGATVFAPAMHTADMIEAVVNDGKVRGKETILVCSANLKGEYGIQGVALGVPVILGREGIIKIEEWDLAEEELIGMRKAADKLKEFYEKVKTD